MRVLHLPCNVASQISDTVSGMRKLGIDARGLCSLDIITSTNNIEVIPEIDTSNLFRRYISYKKLVESVFDVIDWADVVHWYCKRALPGAMDLKYAYKKQKKMVIEFAGSDIRIPEIESADNPYYAEMRKQGLWEYKNESYSRSRRHQKLFAKYNATLLLPYRALDPYILPDIFPIINKTRHRISIERFNPIFPSVDNKKPLIIHSPSKINAKGTPAVLSAIEQLKDKYDFEFQLIHNMPYQQANELLRNCDIFLDQFVLGAHGVAALEAMAYGKPTVCYIKPSQINQYPPELPIVNANKENLPETLSMLLDNAQLRNDIGKQGRAYIEKYHDTDKICRELISLYESI